MSHRLQVLIPPELDARLRKAAQHKGVSKGEWVRAAVVRALPTGEADPLGRLGALDAPTGNIDEMLAEIRVPRACRPFPRARARDKARKLRLKARSRPPR